VSVERYHGWLLLAHPKTKRMATVEKLIFEVIPTNPSFLLIFPVSQVVGAGTRCPQYPQYPRRGNRSAGQMGEVHDVSLAIVACWAYFTRPIG
jgi:hypothetical protein